MDHGLARRRIARNHGEHIQGIPIQGIRITAIRIAAIRIRAIRIRGVYRILLGAGVALVALSIVTTTPAAAIDLDAEDLARLTSEAITDRSARDMLRQVDTIDGHPVAWDDILSGSPRAVEERLRTLSGLLDPDSTVDAAAVRLQAAEILDDARYKVASPRSESILERVRRWLADLIPDSIRDGANNQTFWGIVGIVTIVAVVVLALRSGRRRLRGLEADASASGLTSDRITPSQLEARALQAEQDGDYATAVRLRFVAGVTRLGDVGAIGSPDTATSGAVRRAVRSRDLDRLSERFDAIVYGDESALHADAVDARESWPGVVAATKVEAP